MRDYEVVLFDLDGTLTDSSLGITNSVAYALHKYDIEVSDNKDLYKFIGPPLSDSFEAFYNFSEEQAKQAVKYYREYFSVKGIYENKVYNGVKNLLAKLHASGKILVLATSKLEVFAKQILEHFELAEYFTYVAGSNLDGTRTKKDEVIRYALESIKYTDNSKIVMVGDREHDILGAKKVGIDSIGVLFGFGDRNELETVNATYIAETVNDIEKIILNKAVC